MSVAQGVEVQRSEGFLAPFPHSHLWISWSFCAEQGRGEHAIYKPPAARRAPRESLGEENPPCRDANTPGKSRILVPAHIHPALLRTHLQMEQEKSPLSSLTPTFICHCCTGKTRSQPGETPPRPIPPLQLQQELQNNPAQPPSTRWWPLLLPPRHSYN